MALQHLARIDTLRRPSLRIGRTPDQFIEG
jgi:hypothetical protein